MANVTKMFPSVFLNAQSLQTQPEDKRAVTLIIKEIKTEEVFNPKKLAKEDKWVCYFQGTTKGLILSKTKVAQLAKAWGPETDAWKGKSAILYLVSTTKGPGLMLRPAEDAK